MALSKLIWLLSPERSTKASDFLWEEDDWIPEALAAAFALTLLSSPPHPDARSSDGKACDGEIEPVFDTGQGQVTPSEYLKRTGRMLNPLWYNLVGTTFNKKFCADWTLYIANCVLPVKAGTTEAFPEARSSDTNLVPSACTALEKT